MFAAPVKCPSFWKRTGKLSDTRKKGLLADYRDAESSGWRIPLLIFPGDTYALATGLTNMDMVGDPPT